MSARVKQLAVLDVAEKALKLGSGLSALALAAVLAWRTATVAAPVAKPPALYVPTPTTVAQPGGAVSELESAANGFIILVESTPEGAEVRLDGVSRGASPASLNVDCTPGAPLALELRLRGHAALRHPIRCREDVMLVVRATLEKTPQP